ncbi:HepT-like ribonuclease domain-containing protein [Streptococcus merionis]|uniref:HepT-like ribonuclease domain-containing protein n=1 Tax=Streptococcus merionis TaxID=400065 RepID=UPI00351934D7
MIDFAEEIGRTLEKVKKLPLDFSDEMVISSLAMHIGQIGEQLDRQKLSVELQEEYADIIPWSHIKRFRDKAYHHYSRMDGSDILKIATQEIPNLLDGLYKIKRDLEQHLREF